MLPLGETKRRLVEFARELNGMTLHFDADGRLVCASKDITHQEQKE